MPLLKRIKPRNGFLRLSQLIVLLLALIALGNLAGSEWGLLKKLVHFPAYWAPISLCLFTVLAVMKQWRWAMAALILSIGFAAQVAALWLPPQKDAMAALHPASPPQATLTVLTFNVFKNNKRYAEVLAALQKEQADVVYLTEMSPEWFAALAPLERDYPNRLTRKGISDWLLSKHPLEQAEVVRMTYDSAKAAAGNNLSEEWRATWHNDDLLVATILFDSKRIRIAGLHPPIPSNASRVTQQRACAAIYSQALNSDPNADARMLVGDFNTSRFSPTFRFLLEQTRLGDTAQGFGYKPTWGPRLPREPWLPWCGIPIDHVLASQNVTTLEHEVGPQLGSDHLWVKARLVINPPAAPPHSSATAAAINPDQTCWPTPAVHRGIPALVPRLVHARMHADVLHSLP